MVTAVRPALHGVAATGNSAVPPSDEPNKPTTLADPLPVPDPLRHPIRSHIKPNRSLQHLLAEGTVAVISLVDAHITSRGGPSTSGTDTNTVTIKGQSYTTPTGT